MFKITQWFAENPQNYLPFGLPGHEGVDFAAPTGHQIKAAAAGTVTLVTGNQGNYGIQVRIQHSQNMTSIYAHLLSTNVVQGQTVQSGQLIGLADSTGNTDGSHLHFSQKQVGVTYVDENGTIWPFNFRDPWLSLKHLYDNWLTSNGVIGYVYLPTVKVNIQGSHGRIVGLANLRATPSVNGQLLGQLTSHTVVKILSAPVNNYVQVRTPIDIPVQNPSVSRFGLHFRADPDDLVSQAEYQEQRILLQNNGRTAKLLHNHPVSVYNTVCTMTPKPETMVIRVFQSFGSNPISPQTFVNNNVDELINRVNLVRAYGIDPIVEVHNEPNLNQEGLSSSWTNGNTFGTWLRSVLSLYRQRTALSTVKFIYPGLSPGNSIPGVRQDSTTFLQESISAGVLPFVHGVACHAYWSSTYPMSAAINHVNQTRIATNKPIWVTEASINDRPSVYSPQEYGQRYASFINNVSSEGIYFFVGSASNPYFEPETWVRTNGQAKGIATALVNAL